MKKLIPGICGIFFLCLIFLAQKPEPEDATKPPDHLVHPEHPSIYYTPDLLAPQYHRMKHLPRSPYQNPQNTYRRPYRKNDFNNQVIYEETRNALPYSPFAPLMPENYPLPSPSKVLSLNKPAGVEEAWVRIYESGEIPGDDITVDVAIDADDNIYVTGFTSNLPNGMDFYTIKYDPSGNEVWAKYFDGEAHSDDIAVGVETDTSGNVYVGGFSAGNGTGFDFVVVKYSGAGQEEWIFRYDGSYQDGDQLTGMISDNTGNTYITGRIPGAAWATVKINSRGAQQWEAQYGSTRYYHGYPAITIDSNGNVYTTGYRRKTVSGEGTEFLTIKYNSEGIFQWEGRYRRTANSFNEPAKIVVNDSGEVYVTGVSEIDYDYNITTVKYDAEGTQLWAAYYDSLNYDIASALTLDPEGNIIVTGLSRNEVNVHECITIKYNAGGEQLWVVRYGGDLNMSVSPSSSLVDSLGNIFITGSAESNWITLKYNADGNLQWTSKYDGPGHSYDYPYDLAMDSHKQLVITGTSSGIGTKGDYTTLKYDTDGVQQWESRFSGKNTELGNASDLALDGEGNIYVTGHSYWNILTVKYDSKGMLQWADNSFEGSAVAIETDGYGNAYVLASNNGDVVTIKYNPQGVLKWVAQYDGPPLPYGESYDYPIALRIDHWGNAYVLSESSDGYGWRDFVTLKYTTDGRQEWVARYGGGEQFSDSPRGLVVDNEGNVYVAGERWGPQGSGYIDDFVVIKYNHRGEEQWMAHIDEGDYEQALAVGVDGWGNIYVNGKSELYDSPSTEELITIKYDPSGERQWVARYNEPQHIFGWYSKMKIDVFGNPCITGFIWDVMNYNQDYFTIKYDDEGAEQWIARYDAAGSWDRATDLTLDREGNVYVTGGGSYRSSGVDATTIKYNSTGQEKWVHRHAGNGNARDQGNAIEVDDNGNVYMAGYTGGASYRWEYFKTLKFSQTGADSLGRLHIERYKLEQNYPNPFNNQTLIWYRLPSPGEVTFRIYNSLGEQIREDHSGYQHEGRHAYHFRARNLASGIYFYQIKANNFVKARKMILVQ